MLQRPCYNVCVRNKNVLLTQLEASGAQEEALQERLSFVTSTSSMVFFYFHMH